MRTRLYRIGMEGEGEHYAVLQDGGCVRFPTGELTCATYRQAAAHFLTVTGLPPETHVDVNGNAHTPREAEIRERQAMLEAGVGPQLLAGMLQQPAKTRVTLFADGSWRFGPIDDGAQGVIWVTSVTPALLHAAKEAFVRQIYAEAHERIDRIQNTLTREFV